MGTYILTSTDVNGCTTNQTVIITEPNLFTSNYTTTNWNGYQIQCNGGNNGTITMNVVGGVTSLPYTYQINGTNNNTNIFSSLNQGNYTIIALDGNGCTTDQNVVMTEPALVDAHIHNPTIMELE